MQERVPSHPHSFPYKEIYDSLKRGPFFKTVFFEIPQRLCQFLLDSEEMIPECYWPSSLAFPQIEKPKEDLLAHIESLKKLIEPLLKDKGPLFLKINTVAPKVLCFLWVSFELFKSFSEPKGETDFLPELKVQNFFELIYILKDNDLLTDAM